LLKPMKWNHHTWIVWAFHSILFPHHYTWIVRILHMILYLFPYHISHLPRIFYPL
jgi:hypothetical protein